MKTTAIHQHDDWYSIQISGLGSIQKSKIEVEINITDKEVLDMDYKSLRGVSILERYQEKERRQIVEEESPTYGYVQLTKADIVHTIDELIQKIITLPKRNDVYTR